MPSGTAKDGHRAANGKFSAIDTVAKAQHDANLPTLLPSAAPAAALTTLSIATTPRS
jgi:hypothetical protein